MWDWYTKIKGYYENSLWTKDQVKQGVVYNKITSEQYQGITGELYTV